MRSDTSRAGDNHLHVDGTKNRLWWKPVTTLRSLLGDDEPTLAKAPRTPATERRRAANRAARRARRVHHVRAAR